MFMAIYAVKIKRKKAFQASNFQATLPAHLYSLEVEGGVRLKISVLRDL